MIKENFLPSGPRFIQANFPMGRPLQQIS